jgi:hypothetical protein
MRSALEYEKRAEACRKRAQALSDPRDRAQWLKLADDWITVSRMQFHTPSQHAKQEAPPRAAEQQTRRIGLWRGELGTGLKSSAAIFSETPKS